MEADRVRATANLLDGQSRPDIVPLVQRFTSRSDASARCLIGANAAQRLASQSPQPYLLIGQIQTRRRDVKTAREMFAKAADRDRFLKLLSLLEADPNARILTASDELFRSSVELYRRRADKDWSLTDCSSFIVMERESIREALTADHHFEQAGFIALLK
jgi:hypothetical protein